MKVETFLGIDIFFDERGFVALDKLFPTIDEARAFITNLYVKTTTDLNVF